MLALDITGLSVGKPVIVNLPGNKSGRLNNGFLIQSFWGGLENSLLKAALSFVILLFDYLLKI